MQTPLDTYLKDLLDDMKHAIEQEDCTLNVTSKDVDKVQRLINRNKRRRSQLERHIDVRNLFERKFINYRNKLLSIYNSTNDDLLKAEIKTFLEIEQGNVRFND